MDVGTTLAALLLGMAATAAQADGDTPCEASGHVAEMRCLGQQLKQLEQTLDAAYRAALATRPEEDEFDRRKNREQLRKSQLAWQEYKSENCALVGGLEGGGNLWVSDFATRCELAEVQKRISFLRHVAEGNAGD